MDKEFLLRKICQALEAIPHPYFEMNELGFQGQLLTQLDRQIPQHLLPPGALLQQEYQKTMAMHQLEIRPDIIIHEPFDAARHRSRKDGNVAVIELKRTASKSDARGDFESLLGMLDVLEYPMGVFINIGSQETYAGLIPPAADGRITCLAASLIENRVRITRGP